MFSFDWPWMFLFLPLPYFMWRFSKAEEKIKQGALRVASVSRFELRGHNVASYHNNSKLMWLLIVAWILLVIASARPQWLGDITDVPSSGRDLMLGVDLSHSMRQTDFYMNNRRVTRLTAAKGVVSKFIHRRKGDRIGLIVFGSRAYVHVPLTFDTKTVAVLLEEAFSGMAGGSTAIGDTIVLAVKHLSRSKNKNKVLILLTDGQNTGGQVSPRKATEIAKVMKLRIYTIGIGSPSSRSLDESSLTYIADQTGGNYYRAQDLAAMKKIYREINRLERVKQDPRRYRPVTEMYYWFLVLALFIVLATFFSQAEWRRLRDG